METGNGCCQGFELSSSSRDVGRGLDPVLKTDLVVLDAGSPELALGLTAISISHIDFAVSRHQILQIAIFFLLFLHLFLGLLIGKIIQTGFDIRLCSRSLITISAAPGAALTVTLLGDSFVVLVLVKPLVGDVVVGWSIFHGAVNRSVTIMTLLLFGALLRDAVIFRGLVLLNLVHQA